MKKLIRRTLGRFPGAYSGAKAAYQQIARAAMRAQMAAKGVTYLTPKRPEAPYQSQYGQDYYLETLGLIGRDGFWIEVGCNHPVRNSNSHYLEHQLGWTGISIDGLDYVEAFAEERPKTQFLNALIDDSSKEMEFYQAREVEGWENQVSSVRKDAMGMGKGFEADTLRVKAMPLREVIPAGQTVDLLLVDVEGHEFAVLESMDWDACKPSVIVIENNGDFFPRKKLEDYIVGKGYKLRARIGTSDDIYVVQS